MNDRSSDHPALPMAGGCRCGAVRLSVVRPPLMTAACHCTGCQTMSASAFSLSIGLPGDGLEITRGETVLGGLDRDQHHFCARCMTWMFTRPVGMPDIVNLRATMLDDHGWFAPFVETFTSERLPWATTPAVHSFERLPEDEAWPALIAAYAGRADA